MRPSIVWLREGGQVKAWKLKVKCVLDVVVVILGVGWVWGHFRQWVRDKGVLGGVVCVDGAVGV